MSVQVRCQGCGNNFMAGDEMRGQSVACARCQRRVQVPYPDAIMDEDIGPGSDTPAAKPSSDIFAGDADNIFVNPENVSEDVFGRHEVFDPGVRPGNRELTGDGQTMILPPDAPPALVPERAPPPKPPEPAPPPTPAPESPIFTPVFGVPMSGAPLVPPQEPPPPAEEEHPWLQDQAAAEPPAGSAESVPVFTRPKPRLPASFWLLSVLFPYTIAVTVFAVLLYFRSPPRSQHPLESLVDQGPYEEARPVEIENPKRELPDDVKPLKLHESRTLNDLEVTPLEILRQRVKFSYRDGKRDLPSEDEMLVLRLRLKNVSHPPVIFHPNDPAFVRGSDLAYSYLQIGKRRFYSPLTNVLTERIQGQNFDELLPGATMETIVVAAQEVPTGSENVLAALKKLNPTDSLIWRVHLRKGREKVEVKGRSKMIWATTVLPVAFTPNDVKQGPAAE